MASLFLSRCRGIALLMVVGVLGILSVLGAAFVTLARLERRASLQKVNSSKAQLLARSGVEDMFARLSAGQDPTLATTRYRGEDWNASGTLNGIEVPAEVYRRTGAGTIPDTDACPVRHAMRPVFYARLKPTPNPRVQAVDGRLRGYSGAPGGVLTQYALKVKSGGIYLNGGDPAQPAAAGYNAVLRRMLRTRAEAIDREDGVDDGIPVNLTDGGLLVGLRPAAGWSSWEQVKAALGGSQAKLDVLKPYLTLESWVDGRVIRPNPVAADTRYACWADLRTGRSTVLGDAAPGPATRTAPDFERIPVSGGPVVGRAPVELSWARTRRPVLLALLAGLKGLYLDPGESVELDTSPTNGIQWGDLIGTMKEVEIALDPASFTGEAADVADALLAWTPDISSWADWDAFCDALAFSGTALEVQAKRDVLKANFNPNSALNKFNPNRSRWKSVDKQELSVYSTEFALDPLQGREVESCGRVLAPGGRVLAVRELRATLGGPSVVRISTQREFAAESLGDPFAFGDEGDLRLPGFRRAGSPDFLVRNFSIERTWGHRIDASSKYPGTWLDAGPSCRGVGLQSYPEPCTSPGATLAMTPADWDGNLQLATVETVGDEWYGVPAGGVRDMKSLARFDTRFDLDLSDGAPGCLGDAQLVSTPELANGVLLPVGTSLAAPPKVNTLMPDGCYAERDRSPSYPSASNLHGFRGVVSMWVKRNYDMFQQLHRGGHLFFKATQFEVPLPASRRDDQVFFVTDCMRGTYVSPLPTDCKVGIHFETSTGWADYESEQQVLVPHVQSTLDAGARRWSLLTVCWDSRREQHLLVPPVTDAAQVHVDQGGGPRSSNASGYQKDASGTVADDATVADQFGLHRFSLGLGGGAWTAGDLAQDGNMDTFTWGGAGYPDATLDEVALYDFGGSTFAGGTWVQDASAVAAGAIVASNRWKEGRYYKGWKYNDSALGGSPAPQVSQAAAWYSAPVGIPEGARIRRVSWTWTRPSALPDDFPEVELADAAGALHLWTPDQSRSTRSPGWTHAKPSWEPLRAAPGPFRIKVGFSRVTPVGGADPSDESMVADIPILDSPVLDDVTVLVDPPGGGRMLSWESGGT